MLAVHELVRKIVQARVGMQQKSQSQSGQIHKLVFLLFLV